MSETSPNIDKPHFVLVHGVGGGAWCWYKIRCLMEASGYKVTCLDLKGSGIDPSDPNTILTFQDYNMPLINFFSNLPDHEKVILVGHSAGCLSVTFAIHKFAEKIHAAVYVAGPVLKHGFSTEEDFRDGQPDLSEYGEVSRYEYGFGPDQPPTSVILKEEFQRKIVYNTSPMEDSTLAAMLLRPGPVRALRGAQFTDGKDDDSVPRVYIKAMYDQVLKPEQKDAMIRRWPPAEVYALESDHSPFFSAPYELFALLLKVISNHLKAV